MIPTGIQIAEEIRQTYLGDTEVSGGQLFTNTKIATAIGAAARLLFDQLMRIDDRKVRRTAYYNLPAYTTYLRPADMSITDFGAPKELWDRRVGAVLSGTILAANAATATVPSSVSITITAHGLAVGAEVVAFNFAAMTADIIDIWHIDVADANTIKLLGCSATGSGTGVVSTSTEDFPARPINQVFEAEPRRVASNSSIAEWAWKDGAFRFSPCTSARQLRISYQISGSYQPTGSALNGSVGIDNSMEFIAAYAAALAAGSRGPNATSERLFTLAVGNAQGDPGNADAGYLGALCRPQINAQQNVRVIIPRYREKRNTGFPIGF